jgi:glycosyltransferase involved in cell wall biosynthesis
MRVIYVYPEVLPSTNARGVQVVRTCAALARHARDVLLCVADGPADDGAIFEHYGIAPPVNLAIVRADRRLGPIQSSAAFHWRLRRTLERIPSRTPDRGREVIVTRHVQVPAGLAALRLPVVFEAHELLCEKPGVRDKVRRLEQRVLTQSAGVAFLSNGLRARCLQRLPLDGPTTVIPSGTAAPPWPVGAPAAAETRGSVRDLVYCGSTRYRWKGLHVLLEAVLKLVESGGPCVPRLHIIGQLDEPWSPAHPLIANLRDRGALELHGYVAPGEVPALLRRYPIAVLPNTSEANNSIHYTSPLKLLDYLAAGAAVVASDLPSVRELVGPEQALLVRPDDPQALAVGLRRMMTDSSLRGQLSRNARRRVQDFTWERRGERFVRFFETVLGGASAATVDAAA